MRQTSLLAFSLLTDTKINKRQQQIMKTLQNIEPACNRKVAEISGLPINVITPRMGELVKLGLVRESYKGKDITGRQVIYWVRT